MHIEQTGGKTGINLYTLKGQCHEIFCFRFFHESSSPKPLKKNNIRVISVFLENAWRYSQVKVHHRYQRHHVANLPPVSTALEANFATSTAGVVDTGGKFATGINDTSGILTY
jgi:hypothetical protein